MNQKTIINYTGKRIKEYTTGRVFLPIRKVPETFSTHEIVGVVDRIPIFFSSVNVIEGVPEQRNEEDTLYLVPEEIATVYPNRSDLVYPGDMVFKDGIALGCNGFKTVNKGKEIY